jgi:hypothetical protein
MIGLLVSNSSGVVLCIRDDGHLSVDSERHDHTGHTHDAADHTHDGAVLGDGDSAACEAGGDCVDVPLGNDRISPVTKTLRQDHFLKNRVAQYLSVGCELFTQTGFYQWQRFCCSAETHLAQSLLEKRSIVLRV